MSKVRADKRLIKKVIEERMEQVLRERKVYIDKLETIKPNTFNWRQTIALVGRNTISMRKLREQWRRI